MYRFKLGEKADKNLKKLKKKNPKGYYIVDKKIEEIITNPHRFKNLKRPLQRYKRVHVDDSFVLCFRVDDDLKLVTFVFFGY